MIKNCIICNAKFETFANNRVACGHRCRMKVPCSVCGEIDRYKNEECKSCKKKYNKARYWKNPEKMKQEKREYYYNNREILIQKSKEWCQKNRKKSNEIKEKWAKNNPDKVKEMWLNYYKNNRDEITKRNKKWKKNNLEKIKEYKYKRIARKKNLPHKPYDFNLICKFYNNICLCCKKEKKLTIDHVIPLSWDTCPGDIPSNIQPLCLSCNSSKNNKHDTDYRPDEGVGMLKYLDKRKDL